MTSGSATSIEATSFSAMRTFSGVSRITMALARSLTTSVLASSTVFSSPSTSLGGAVFR